MNKKESSMVRQVIIFLSILMSTMLYGQSSQEIIRQNNIQKSWVKSVPFAEIPFTQGIGQITDIAKNPQNSFEMYVATAHSGVWYSNNNGASFVPLFTDEMSQNVSAIAVDWASKTLWVATSQGIFYTENTGEKWTFVGLATLKNIQRIVATSASEVYLSALGEGENSQRGIFKTTDKGKYWQHIFGQVGVTDITITSKNPETIYITAWDTETSPLTIIPFGKKSGIYKSTDSGATWKHITGQNSGFLQNNVGRISLAAFDSNRIYALVDNRNKLVGYSSQNISIEKLSAQEFLNLDNIQIETYLCSHNLQSKYSAENLRQIIRAKLATPLTLGKYLDAEPEVVGAEIYLSTDGGTSWKKQNNQPLTNVFYNKGYEISALAVHPKRENELYLSAIPLLRSTDGGKSWKLIKDNPLNNKVKRLWVDEQQIVYVNNLGISQSYDQGKTWLTQNIPQTIEVCALSVGNPEKQTLFASIDNLGIWKYSHLWQQISPDNGKLVVDTNDKCYIAQPFGEIHSLQTNESTSMPAYDKGKLRFSQHTPLIISPQNNAIIYTGSNYLHQSLNEGKQWNTISSDLTNGDKGGNQAYGTISAIAESPFQFGLLYTGSDDGMIYTSQNGGVSWQMVYSSFPEPNTVVCLTASQHQKNRIYAVLRSQQGKVLVFKSENSGKTWDNIKANLPEENANVLIEDNTNEQLLYLGTESGLYVSFDRGEKWHIFQKNLPRVSVNQIVINPKTNIMYIGTKGRGIFQTDIRPLKEMRAAVQDQVFYPLQETYSIIHSSKWGNTASAWEQPEIPTFYFDAFASKATNKIVVKISKEGVVLNTFTYTTQQGFNFLPYNLTLSEEGRVAYEKKKQKAIFKKATDGNFYLPKGTYQVLFEGDLVEEERILQIK